MRSLGDRLRQKLALRPGTFDSPLAEGFLNGDEVTCDWGTCYRISKSIPAQKLILPGRAERLNSNLQLLYGVGPVMEERLRLEKMSELADLVEHPRWGRQARRLLRAIHERDVGYLRGSGAGWLDLLCLFDPTEVVFLDIETTGLYHTLPLFLIGLLSWQDGSLRLVQYVARSFEEEESVLAHCRAEIGKYRVVVTYNGGTFDLPYLKGRCRACRIDLSLPQLHVDLLPWVRREYGDLLPNCCLTTVERYLLDFGRADDLPGSMVPETYHRFVKEQDPSILEPVITHNERDLLSLSRILAMITDDDRSLSEDRKVSTDWRVYLDVASDG